MKRILYVELSSGYGGSSEALFNSLKYLNRNTYGPLLLTTRHGKNFDRIANLGVKVINVPLLNLKLNSKDHYLLSYLKAVVNLILVIFPNSFRIWHIIRRERIDLVHTNTVINDNFSTILAAKWARVPCICHVRETRALSRLEKYFKQLPDFTVALTQESFDILSEGNDPKKVILIPDGLDLCLKDCAQGDLQKIKNDFSLEGKFCIGILGRLVRGKGQDDFIQAASIILKEHKNVKFLIVGNDPDQDSLYEKKLRSLVLDLHIEENLIFTGWRTDKNEIISVLDLVVQASSTFPEGFGLTCIEAMALRKPVVATNIPGPKSIVVDGITGFLVPPSDPKLLADAILKIIRDPLLGSKMGEAGKCRVEEHFDIKIVVGRIENMYGKILT